jgi:hypothetical protein
VTSALITAALVALTLAWAGLAFLLFVGADQLAARLRRREPAFDWFDRTRWSGRSTPAKQRVTAAMGYVTGAVVVLAALTLLLALVGIALDRPASDSPRPPAPRDAKER